MLKINEKLIKKTYSTKEHVIGTWIDGKPLYEKTYQINGYEQDISDLNCDTVFVDIANSFCYADDNKNTVLTLPRVNTSNVANQIEIRVTKTKINIYVGSTSPCRHPIVTIKYTKTTD